MIDSHTLTMKCPACGEVLELQKYCPYTGMRHGHGWEYCCPRCRTEMKEVE